MKLPLLREELHKTIAALMGAFGLAGGISYAAVQWHVMRDQGAQVPAIQRDTRLIKLVLIRQFPEAYRSALQEDSLTSASLDDSVARRYAERARE